jgi:probable rRNA maturation factor
VNAGVAYAARAGATIAVAVEDDRWRAVAADVEDRCRIAAAAALDAVGAGDSGELSLLLTDDARVRALNAAYRGRDAPTNVLAFGGTIEAGAGREPPADAPRLLGDVVLALETVGREAQEQGKSIADHVSHLIVHGTLHLLGFDHGPDRPARRMEALEIATLAGLGIADPYRPPAAHEQPTS